LRLVEARIVPVELCSAEPSIPNIAIGQIELVEVGSGEVQVDAGPEDFPHFGSEMRAQNALRGQPNLQLLASLLVAGVRFAGASSADG
jgi:hypothetical protein